MGQNSTRKISSTTWLTSADILRLAGRLVSSGTDEIAPFGYEVLAARDSYPRVTASRFCAALWLAISTF